MAFYMYHPDGRVAKGETDEDMAALKKAKFVDTPAKFKGQVISSDEGVEVIVERKNGNNNQKA